MFEVVDKEAEGGLYGLCCINSFLYWSKISFYFINSG